jgi:hypothetical protein
MEAVPYVPPEGQWTRYEGESGIPYFYNEETGETTWDDPNQYVSEQQAMVEASVEEAFVGNEQIEAPDPEHPEVDDGPGGATPAAGDATAEGGAEGGENAEGEDFDSEKKKELQLQKEMDEWPQSYEELLHYGDEQEAGTRGLQVLKKCMPKVIFEHLQLHEKDEGAPVLQELEKMSLAHNCVAAAKETKRADRMVKEAAELRRKQREGSGSEYSYYSGSSEVSSDTESSDVSSLSEDSDDDDEEDDKKKKKKVTEEEDVHTFKNRDAILPEYLILKTEVWEEVAIVTISKQSQTISLAIFLGGLIAMCVSKTAATSVLGESAFNAQWTLRTLVIVLIVLMTWWHIVRKHMARVAKKRYIYMYVMWTVISLAVVSNGLDKNIIGEIPYPEIWLRRANYILVRLYYAVLWYANLMFIPFIAVKAAQEVVKREERDIEDAMDRHLSMVNLTNSSKRPVSRELLRERAKQMHTRKLSRTISFFAKQYRYHGEDNATTYAFRLLYFGMFVEVMHTVSIWPNPVTAAVNGIHAAFALLVIPVTSLLLADENALYLDHHAGYGIMLMMLEVWIIPSAGSSFMETVYYNQDETMYAMAAILGYHLYMQAIMFKLEKICKRAWYNNGYAPLMATMQCLDAMFANYIILFASANNVTAGLGILLMFARTLLWEFGFWTWLSEMLYGAPVAIMGASENVETMDEHNHFMACSRSRFLIQMACGLWVPIIMGLEPSLGFGSATLSNGTDIPMAGGMIFFVNILNLGAFCGAWHYRKHQIQELWRAITYDPGAGEDFPEPIEGTTLEKVTHVEWQQRRQWITITEKLHWKQKPATAIGEGKLKDQKKKKKKAKEGDGKKKKKGKKGKKEAGEEDGEDADDEADDDDEEEEEDEDEDDGKKKKKKGRCGGIFGSQTGTDKEKTEDKDESEKATDKEEVEDEETTEEKNKAAAKLQALYRGNAVRKGGSEAAAASKGKGKDKEKGKGNGAKGLLQQCNCCRRKAKIVATDADGNVIDNKEDPDMITKGRWCHSASVSASIYSGTCLLYSTVKVVDGDYKGKRGIIDEPLEEIEDEEKYTVLLGKGEKRKEVTIVGKHLKGKQRLVIRIVSRWRIWWRIVLIFCLALRSHQ